MYCYPNPLHWSDWQVKTFAERREAELQAPTKRNVTSPFAAPSCPDDDDWQESRPPFDRPQPLSSESPMARGLVAHAEVGEGQERALLLGQAIPIEKPNRPLLTWPMCRNRLGIERVVREKLSGDDLAGLIVTQAGSSGQFVPFFLNGMTIKAWSVSRWVDRGPRRCQDPAISKRRQDLQMRNRIKRIRKGWRKLLVRLAKPIVATTNPQTPEERKSAYRLALKQVKLRITQKTRWHIKRLGERDVASRAQSMSHSDDMLMARVCEALGENAYHLLSLGCSVRETAEQVGIPRRTMDYRLRQIRESLGAEYAPSQLAKLPQ